MIRMSKLADYGIVLMTELARDSEIERNRSARELAESAHLPLPVVSKILKALTREGLLRSTRGIRGGYSLASPPESISVGAVISAMEGPVAMTECVESAGDCSQEGFCPVRRNWRKISDAISRVLYGITLADMMEPLPGHLVPLGGLPVDPSGSASNVSQP